MHADLYARTFVCEPSDVAAVMAYLRASPFVAPESVREVAESHRVQYDIDETRVPAEDVACACLAVSLGLDRVVPAHGVR